MTDRDFKPPDHPPSHTGTLWLRPDKTLGATITDVFGAPIHIIATKEDDHYWIRGWRGEQPEHVRIPLVDDGKAWDGLPTEPCARCEGRLFWRESVMTGAPDTRVWQCAVCAPADPGLWIDGAALPKKKQGTLL